MNEFCVVLSLWVQTFLHLLICLYLNPQVFSLLLFQFLPLSQCGRSEQAMCGAQLPAVLKPQHPVKKFRENYGLNRKTEMFSFGQNIYREVIISEKTFDFAQSTLCLAQDCLLPIRSSSINWLHLSLGLAVRLWLCLVKMSSAFYWHWSQWSGTLTQMVFSEKRAECSVPECKARDRHGSVSAGRYLPCLQESGLPLSHKILRDSLLERHLT